VEEKRCTKCKEVKALEEFSRDRKRTDGRQYQCKSCNKEYAAGRYRTNKEEIDRRNREWGRTNPAKLLSSRRAYETANRDRLNAAARARRLADPEPSKAAQERYRARHPDAVVATKRRSRAKHADSGREYSRRYRAENPERVAAWNRDWYRRNPDKARLMAQARRALLAAATVEDFTPADLFADWEDHDLYGCFFCGCSLTDGYHIEHFQALDNGGDHALYNLVPSCPKCNLSKGARDEWAFLASALAARGVDMDRCVSLFDDHGRLIRST
jgi:5-methylcytosine-specific restriction endonuclease McrA